MPSDRVPPPLKQILQLDQKLSKKFCDLAFELNPSLSKRTYLKTFEISCHGIPWFAFTLISIFLFRSSEAREIEINLFFGLLLDVIIVAFIKALTRRARPVGNKNDDILAVMTVDKFSFPSGHATRAVYVALFFTRWAFPESSIILTVFLYTWAASVCLSRILMKRHFILDVASGVFIGYFEFLLTGILWIGPTASKWLGDFLSSSADDTADVES